MAKLAIFDKVILWESFIVGNSEQLSHSITVPNLNGLVNIWMILLSTNNRDREIVNRIRIADPNSVHNVTPHFFVDKSPIHILTKLFKLATVMIWKSCSELQTMNFSHSITVSNIASLANIVYI